MSFGILAIVGATATGKTTLAQTLSNELHWPLIAKDDFKEILFDQLGSKDLAWSRKLGATSFELLWHSSYQLAKSKLSHIIEYPTTSPDFLKERLADLRSKYGARVFVIELTSSPAVRRKRFQNRIANGSRHSGHPESTVENLEFVENESFAHSLGADKYCSHNTDDFSKLDSKEILNWINEEFRRSIVFVKSQ